MDVEMRNGLSAVVTAIDHQSETGLAEAEICCKLLPGQQEATQQRAVTRLGFRKPWDYSFRNHQYMNRRLWIDIVERQNLVIFEDDLRRDFSSNDFFE